MDHATNYGSCYKLWIMLQIMDHATNTSKGKTLTYMRPTTDIAPPSISAHEWLWACEQKYAILQHL